MAQWWRICLPMQETQVRSLIQEDPTCGRATKPMCHNYWACAPEPENHNYWVCSRQLLKLAPPRACAPQQEQWEAYVPQLDSSPGSPPLEKSPRSNKDPTKTKINKQHCLKKKKKGNSSQWGGEFMSLEAEKPKLLLTLWLNSWHSGKSTRPPSCSSRWKWGLGKHISASISPAVPHPWLFSTSRFRSRLQWTDLRRFYFSI